MSQSPVKRSGAWKLKQVQTFKFWSWPKRREDMTFIGEIEEDAMDRMEADDLFCWTMKGKRRLKYQAVWDHHLREWSTSKSGS